MSAVKKTTVKVMGMHCPSCDILIQDKFGAVSNVCSVKANHQTRKVEIHYTGKLNTNALNATVARFGYQIPDNEGEVVEETMGNRLKDAGVIATLLFIAYFFIQELGLVPEIGAVSSLTLSSVLVFGLIASTSTCMATAGALYLATIGTMRSKEQGVMATVVPAIGFNIGRIITYAGMGYLTGYVGQTLSVDFRLSSFLSIAVSLMMVLLGLNMLRLISLSSVLPYGMTKGLFQKIQSRLIKSPKRTAFFLGALTYILPCGFTQTVQVYALGVANPVQSMLIMTMFALGTMPALMAIGFASSLIRSKYYLAFSKVVGVLIVMIGIQYIATFFGVSSLISSTQALGGSVTMKNGFQVAEMEVNGKGYFPNSFVVKKDVPVKWVIKGENVFGCQGFLTVPKIGLSRTLEIGENIIEFTPKEKGSILFSCSMGMFRGNFTVI
jgi:uncharacterized protein